jgi:hypothetical protein
MLQKQVPLSKLCVHMWGCLQSPGGGVLSSKSPTLKSLAILTPIPQERPLSPLVPARASPPPPHLHRCVCPGPYILDPLMALPYSTDWILTSQESQAWVPGHLADTCPCPLGPGSPSPAPSCGPSHLLAGPPRHLELAPCRDCSAHLPVPVLLTQPHSATVSCAQPSTPGEALLWGPFVPPQVHTYCP